MAAKAQPWHYTALQLAMAGADPSIIAARLQKTPGRVRALLKSEWAQQQMVAFNAAVMEGAAKERIDPILRFQSLITRAIDKLEALMEAADEKTAYLAVCRVLDNAGLKPAIRVAAVEDDALRQLTIDQMREVRRTGVIPSHASAATILGEVIHGGVDPSTEEGAGASP